MQPQQLTVFDAQPDVFTFCTWGNVNIHVWWAPIDEAMVERLSSFSTRTMRAHPGGMSFVHIVSMSVTLPDAPTRGALLALGKRFENDVGPTAVVVGGEGFVASALRGAITGLWLAVPKSMPMRLCANLEDVVAWLPAKHAESSGVALDPDELRRILHEAQKPEQSHAPRHPSVPTGISLIPPARTLPPAAKKIAD